MKAKSKWLALLLVLGLVLAACGGGGDEGGEQTGEENPERKAGFGYRSSVHEVTPSGSHSRNRASAAGPETGISPFPSSHGNGQGTTLHISVASQANEPRNHPGG